LPLKKDKSIGFLPGDAAVQLLRFGVIAPAIAALQQ
jgi:hypothetical protein